ncbi:hypothetical protein ACLOJK_026280 [Asimina triloba]
MAELCKVGREALGLLEGLIIGQKRRTTPPPAKNSLHVQSCVHAFVHPQPVKVTMPYDGRIQQVCTHVVETPPS